MCNIVVSGAPLKCSAGSSQASFSVLPLNRIFCGENAVAGIRDTIPLVNIPPFGMCSSFGNPTVAAATVAAQGTLTPMPCIPSIAGPWIPGSRGLLLGSMPALTTESKAMCAYGGVITIVHSNQSMISYNQK